jgi:hypothetical protein
VQHAFLKDNFKGLKIALLFSFAMFSLSVMFLSESNCASLDQIVYSTEWAEETLERC